MSNDYNTNTSDGRHDSVTDGERRGIDPSTIENINTTRGDGAELTSTLDSVVEVECPET